VSTDAAAAGAPVVPRPRADAVSPVRAFWAVLWRDLFVTGRELGVFLVQVILQPFFLLFVFGKVLADLGYTRPGYSQILFPGVVALTAVLTALQTTALPLVIDFSWSKEIEDRLLAPLPTAWVALEKMVFSALRSLLAAAMMFPIGIIVLGHVPFRLAGLPLLVVVLVLGALVGAAMGLTLGTVVQPNRINIAFALVLTPLLFTGCTQYPWPSLSKLPWFKVVTAFNPLTYCSEGLRAAMIPYVPHIPGGVCVLMLAVFLVVFTVAGVVGFDRRAID
jgi:ABC-2 type transport system permease protein